MTHADISKTIFEALSSSFPRETVIFVLRMAPPGQSGVSIEWTGGPDVDEVMSVFPAHCLPLIHPVRTSFSVF